MKKYFHFNLVSLNLILVFTSSVLSAQFEKNPLHEIKNQGYAMIIEKFVKVPDDNGSRPRINSMAFFGERFFASTEGGKIYEITGGSAILFFDVAQAIPFNTYRQLVATNNWHSGLRGIAFHPDFQENGKFYTSLMEERPVNIPGHHYISDVENPIEADGVVVEWTFDFDKNEVDPNSYREVFRVGVPAFDHTIKQIAFNRYAISGDEDYGLLYVAHGDGNPYYAPAEGGQNNDARGKILRIDPLQADSMPYSVPSSNPFVNDPEWLDEIYSTGHRNPHTLCFARNNSGEVYLISGNAGQEKIEEINVVEKGGNYGWSEREGTFVHYENGSIAALPGNEANSGFIYPAAQWSRTDPVFEEYNAFSIAGGYVVMMEGTGEKIFLSSDFPQSGFILFNWLDDLTNAVTKLDPFNPERDEPEELTQAPFVLLNIFYDDDHDPLTSPVEKSSMLDLINDDPDYDNSGRSDIRFGQDAGENVYISSKRNGWIYKVQSVTGTVSGNIPEGYSKNYIHIYPNPVSKDDLLQILLEDTGEAQLSVINSEGIQWFSECFSISDDKKLTIDLSKTGIPPGFYFFQITYGKRIFSTPLVIF